MIRATALAAAGVTLTNGDEPCLKLKRKDESDV